LWDWNATCVPPWTRDELAAKLDYAAKYSTGKEDGWKALEGEKRRKREKPPEGERKTSSISDIDFE
jgi:hypothetical protein